MANHPNGVPIRTDLKKRPERDDSNIYETVFPDNYLGDILKGVMVCFLSKQEHRLGWPRKSACSDPILLPHPNESVAAHQWGVAFLVMTITRHPKFQEENPDFNRLNAIEMSLFHDVPEVITGDITPVDGISPEEKHKLESAAMKTIVGCFPQGLNQSMHSVYIDYENRKCKESKFVKDCDRLDFMIQSFLLERQGFTGFAEFYGNSSRDEFSSKMAKDLATVLIDTRNQLAATEQLYRKKAFAK